MLERRGATSSGEAAATVYGLAAKGRYGEIEKSARCGLWALDSLKLMDKEHGTLESWTVTGSGAQPLGRPGWARVEVRRGGGEYIDDVTLMDSVHPVDIVEYSKADYDAGLFDRGIRAAKPADGG